MTPCLGVPLPARGSATCSTSGRSCNFSVRCSGGKQPRLRRHVLQCRAHQSNTGANARQPYDSIDREWQALNHQRASFFPLDDHSLWEYINNAHDLSEQAGFQNRLSTDTFNQFWEYNPQGFTGYWDGLCRVHVILFGIGEGDPEGIYSLRAQPPGGDQIPQETIIAFQDAEDAQRYAGLLEATMDRPSSVVPINPSELLEFCKESGYHCRLEKNGSLITPPDYNVDVTDWERSLRLRSGEWNVMAENLTADTPETLDFFQSVFPQNNAGVYLPSENPAALEEVRCRLEKLMQLES